MRPSRELFSSLLTLHSEVNVEASQQFGSTEGSTLVSGSRPPPPRGCSRSWWRTTRTTPTCSTTPTGSSFPLPTLMATTGPGTTTGCGGRQDLITEAFSIARWARDGFLVRREKICTAAKSSIVTELQISGRRCKPQLGFPLERGRLLQ